MNTSKNSRPRRNGMTAAPMRLSERVYRVLVVVGHPDDETLWVGGTIMMRSDWCWRIVSLCRGNDQDRRPRFFNALTTLGASGSMGDLDDGPTQQPQSDRHVQEVVMGQLQKTNYDLIITHSPFGEYTRHRRHEEAGRAVLCLWQSGALTAGALRLFAYSDKKRTRLPLAIENAHLIVTLTKDIWNKKQTIIQNVYGFGPQSWEVAVTPKNEAFWCFDSPQSVVDWQQRYLGLTTRKKEED